MSLAEAFLPHYTYDDYVQWEGKWEIIDGIPYAMAPSPSIEHQDISQKIAVELHNDLKECASCKALLPVDWQITEDTVVQPDNLVVCGEIKSNIKLLQTPSIVFEVLSPSTKDKDRTKKYALYEDAKVPYYIIVDPLTKSAQVYAFEAGKYDLKRELTDEHFVFRFETCKMDFDFSMIF